MCPAVSATEASPDQLVAARACLGWHRRGWTRAHQALVAIDSTLVLQARLWVGGMSARTCNASTRLSKNNCTA
eukprot:9504163-Pyramimonas_sp.AAC.1